MALLQTVLVLIIVYYLFKLLLKWLAPRLFGYAIKKTGERFGRGFSQYQSQYEKPKKEGETTIFKSPQKNRKSTKKVGEYIDFEEIE